MSLFREASDCGTNNLFVTSRNFRSIAAELCRLWHDVVQISIDTLSFRFEFSRNRVHSTPYQTTCPDATDKPPIHYLSTVATYQVQQLLSLRRSRFLCCPSNRSLDAFYSFGNEETHAGNMSLSMTDSWLSWTQMPIIVVTRMYYNVQWRRHGILD